jgi:4'-phosphopantetheinyl transferase EntD
MIDEILPGNVVAVETRQDVFDIDLFPEEEAVVANAVDKRRREFTTARACARAALEKLDIPSTPIAVGERGEPLWPDGVIGSITHCADYRACAVARDIEVATIGIDAEPHDVLPDGVLGQIARPEELARMQDLRRQAPGLHWDRLLFCMKEAVYKAWFPMARRWLGFEDASVEVDRDGATFEVALLVPGPTWSGGTLTTLSGRWIVRDELVLAAIVLPETGS